MNLMVFFFSSRRRHTRYWRDWSSDVCSSDLDQAAVVDDEAQVGVALRDAAEQRQEAPGHGRHGQAGALGGGPEPVHRAVLVPGLLLRAHQRVAQALLARAATSSTATSTGRGPPTARSSTLRPGAGVSRRPPR